MRALLAIAIGTLAAVAVSQAQTSSTADRPTSLEQVFTPNGRVRMDLSAGGYRISASNDNKIRMRWTTRHASDLRRVRASADVKGSDATISTDGPGNNFEVEIQVPSPANLHVRLTAGELRIKGVEGDKNVKAHAGEIDIEVGKAEQYRRVEASIWAGELQLGPFGRSKEGLFRSFDWNGQGRYRLDAHLKAGEVRFH
jgi:hypothetical protein